MLYALRIIFGLAFCLQAHGKTEMHVLVSFSMPVDTIVALANSAEKIGARLAIRGLVDGDFKSTGLMVSKVSHKSGAGLDINPELFSKVGAKSVPCFVLVDSKIDGSIKAFDKVSGNVTLDYALEQISKRGELSDDARELLKKLRAGNV